MGYASCLPFPLFFSTVVPGKLLIFCLRPVSKLKRVDFPQLGFPISAMNLAMGVDFQRFNDEEFGL